jgi:hypothetical protein
MKVNSMVAGLVAAGDQSCNRTNVLQAAAGSKKA